MNGGVTLGEILQEALNEQDKKKMNNYSLSITADQPEAKIAGIKALRGALTTSTRNAGLAECKNLFEAMHTPMGGSRPVTMHVTAEQLGNMTAAGHSAEGFPFWFRDIKLITPTAPDQIFRFNGD